MIKNIMKNIGPKPSTDVAYLKGSEDPQLKADVKKAISTHHVTGNNLMNVLYNKDKELYKKLDAMGTTNAEQFINQLAYGEEETQERSKAFDTYNSHMRDLNSRAGTAAEENKKFADWGKRAKGERTETLIAWLNDWEDNPQEKDEIGFNVVKTELSKRGVNKNNMAEEKAKADKERNEIYRQAYEN